MCSSTVEKALPETSMWHGAIREEDVRLVRRRHAEKVEEWLDFADFATELFKLHEKYGIETGEEGYLAYRKHLRTSYYQKLETYGPTPDPLDEGCDCIFCRMHAEDEPAESATGKIRETSQAAEASRLGQVPAESPSDFEQPAEPEACRVRCADQPGEELHHEDGPHSGPYTTSEHDHKVRQKKLGRGRVLHVDHAVQEGHPVALEYEQQIARQNSRSRLGQVTAEPPINIKQPTESEACRVRCADRIAGKHSQSDGPHSGPYATSEHDREVRPEKLGPVPADKKIEGAKARMEAKEKDRGRQKKLGRVPAYFAEAVVDSC